MSVYRTVRLSLLSLGVFIYRMDPEAAPHLKILAKYGRCRPARPDRSAVAGRYAIRETLRENRRQSRKPVGRFENVIGDVPRDAWNLRLVGGEVCFGVVRERVFERSWPGGR